MKKSYKFFVSFFVLFICNFTLNTDICKSQWVQTNGPYGGDIQCLAISGSNLFAGIKNFGVFLSTNNGTNWTAVNNGLTEKDAKSLHLSGNNLFVGSEEVFLSINNGECWTSVNNGLTERIVNAFVTSGNNIYAGASSSYRSENGGFFLSTNNGKNWISKGLTELTVFSLAINETQIFAGTNNGVFLSLNNGDNWSSIGLSEHYVSSLVINGTNIFAGTWGNGGVFLSTNNGGTWTTVNNGLTDLFVNCLIKNNNKLLAGTRFNGVFLSTNNGGSWTAVSNGLTELCVNAIATSGTNIYAGTWWGGGVFLSTNNGGNWTAINSDLNTQFVSSLFLSGTNIFAVTENKRIFRSTNNGESWTIINNGLPNEKVKSLVVMGEQIFIGTESVKENGGVFRSTDNGNSWISVNKELGVTSFVVIGTNIFAGTNRGIFFSTNNGESWNSRGLSNRHVQSLVTDGTNLFAGISGWDDEGESNRGVFLSTDNGISWILVNKELPITNMPFLFLSGNNLFAVTGGDGVFLSTNKGENWNHIGFTNRHVFSITAIGSTFFVGTADGVFYSTNNGEKWLNFNQGFNFIPNVHSLLIVNNYIFAGTLDNSVWRRELKEILSDNTVEDSITIELNKNKEYNEKRFRAFNLFESENYSDAILILLELIGTDKYYNFHYLFKLAYCYTELKKYDEALYYYNELIKLDPESSSAYNNIGAIYQETGKYEKAKEYYEKAYNVKPEEFYKKNLNNIIKKTEKAETNKNNNIVYNYYKEAFDLYMQLCYDSQYDVFNIDFKKVYLAKELCEKGLQYKSSYEFGLKQILDLMNRVILSKEKFPDLYK
ncbi:MAG: tetratricopeptide repeat protein [Ignavibacteriae bacterium]|nr:tetratricopeptide repeat protein [Ignavibacteriota bacterium]